MTIEEQEASINGELIRLTRESRGWVLGDLATRSCMSVRQIRQLEEGGTSSFYSVGVKVTAAKRVASLLGLTPEQVFLTPEELLPAEAPLVLVSQTVMVSQAESDALSSVSSHAEELAPSQTDVPAAEGIASPQPAAPVEPAPELVDAVAGAAAQTAAVPHNEDTAAPHKENAQSKPKLSLWAILGLFVAALGVAAVMRPPPEPVALESAPPVETLTDESPAPSSSSLAPASAALTEVASAPLVAVSTKPAVSSASSGGAAVTAVSASAARVPATASTASATNAASAPRPMAPSSAAALPASSLGVKTP